MRAAVGGTTRAVILLGRSGAGKSTAARNAGRAGGIVLCDDGVLLKRGPTGAWTAVPLPGCAGVGRGSRPLHPLRLPVAGLCFLEQSSVDRLRPLSPAQSAKRLVESSLIEVPAAGFLPRDSRIAVFHALSTIAHELPCFVLDLRRGPAFFDLVRRELALDAS